MSHLDTDLAIPKTIEDYCEQRDKVVAMMGDYYRTADLANKLMQESVRYGLDRNAMPHDGIETAIRNIDRSFWRTAFEQTGFMQLMDAETRRKFEREVQDNPPVFNIENIRTTFLDLSLQAEKMFSDGLVNVFKKLRTDYKSNSVFKIGEKVVMTGMVQSNWLKGKQVRYGWAEDELNDLDRVFKVLDGKKHIPRSLSCAMNTAFAENKPYDGEYFEARAYKNSNIHLRIKRADLLEKANMMIARHYGESAISREARA